MTLRMLTWYFLYLRWRSLSKQGQTTVTDLRFGGSLPLIKYASFGSEPSQDNCETMVRPAGRSCEQKSFKAMYSYSCRLSIFCIDRASCWMSVMLTTKGYRLGSTRSCW